MRMPGISWIDYRLATSLIAWAKVHVEQVARRQAGIGAGWVAGIVGADP